MEAEEVSSLKLGTGSHTAQDAAAPIHNSQLTEAVYYYAKCVNILQG